VQWATDGLHDQCVDSGAVPSSSRDTAAGSNMMNITLECAFGKSLYYHECVFSASSRCVEVTVGEKNVEKNRDRVTLDPESRRPAAPANVE
jgi:hypothetical protein